MSSIEIIILCVTGVVACLTYLVKHFKKSECWSKDSCCTCKMDKDDKSKSDLSIDSSENKDANLKSPRDDFLPQKRDVVISSSENKEKKEYVEKEDLKVTVSSTI